MTHFNLLHCIPNPRLHGLNGYREVIETIAWGLRELGNEVSLSKNRHEPSATNIIFGAQVLPVDQLRGLPKNSIVYNFEPMRGLSPTQVRPGVHFIARNFKIWDYSRDNLPVWSSLGNDTARAVPVAFAPVLQRIPRASEQDIDVLMYGLSGEMRVKAFHMLTMVGLCTVFICGLYGEARDQLIARSKIVLNVNLYAFSKIFEIVRVSYLLANRKAVVAVVDDQTAVDPELHGGIRFTSLEKLVPACIELVDSEQARRSIEEAGFEIFSKRKVVPILAEALR
jgi:hypothetical protein